MPVASHGLTVKHNGRARELRTPCQISVGFDPTTDPQQPYTQFQAIWDTGATNCVVSARVVAACGLIATGIVETHGVHGSDLSKTYVVNVVLPNGVQFPNVQVTEGVLGNDDVLLGMDVITMGDFAVTNKDGLTYMSFRVPARGHIDYVVEAQELAVRKGANRPKRPGKNFGRNKKK